MDSNKRASRKKEKKKKKKATQATQYPIMQEGDGKIKGAENKPEVLAINTLCQSGLSSCFSK